VPFRLDQAALNSDVDPGLSTLHCRRCQCHCKAPPFSYVENKRGRFEKAPEQLWLACSRTYSWRRDQSDCDLTIGAQLTGRLRIFGICAPGEVHDLGLLMLLEFLRHSGAAANLIDQTTLSEVRDFVKRYALS
jgi:hypothetical protein